MSLRRPDKKAPLIVSLIFVEGDTEEEFYEKVFKKYIGNTPKKVKNLHGNINIHGKIFDKTLHFLRNNLFVQVRIYCFVDRESRSGNSPLDLGNLRARFRSDKDFKGKVLSVDQIIATPMIESWFFHDMEGIYRFLKVPRNERRPNKFKVVERFNADNLSRLFDRYDKVYIKGKKCKNFINHLSMEKVYAKCSELRNGIRLILKNANK